MKTTEEKLFETRGVVIVLMIFFGILNVVLFRTQLEYIKMTKALKEKVETLDGFAHLVQTQSQNTNQEQGEQMNKLKEKFEGFVETAGYFEFQEPEKRLSTYFTNDPKKRDWYNLQCDSEGWRFSEEEFPGEYDKRNAKCSQLAKQLNFVYPTLQ